MPLRPRLTLGPSRIARQAILDTKRAVFGHALFDRSLAADQHPVASDTRRLFNMVSVVDSETREGTKTLLLNCTHDSLTNDHLDLISPKRVVLELPSLPASQMQFVGTRLVGLQDVRRRGFRIAFDYSVLTRPYEFWLPLASFIKFDLSILKPEVIASFVRLAKEKSQAQLIAENVETSAQHQFLISLGVTLFQGYWFVKPMVVPGQAVRPAQANILQLINLVCRQASTDHIEELLKRDPTLSFNLLRFINSAALSAGTEVTSFQHAVKMFGLNRLFKWATLLLTTSRARDAAPAVGTTAVVRGRFMELLATELLPDAERDNAFVVGVFSLLDTMLGISMAEAMATLTLPDSVTCALLQHTGPLAPLLKLTLACESGDDTAFVNAIASLGLTINHVNSVHLQALAWAETIGQESP